MTRAEFANKLAKYWMSLGMLEGESLVEFANRTNDNFPEDYYAIELAHVATNGFDPEPDEAEMNASASELWHLQYLNTPVGKREQSQESAKRSRQFVGSHKLPYDSDWD